MGAISVPATSARACLRAPKAGDSDRSRRAAHPIDIGPGGRTRIMGAALPASELKGGGTSLIGIPPPSYHSRRRPSSTTVFSAAKGERQEDSGR